MSGKLLIALLGVSCNTDSTDDLAIVVANQHAAAFGKDLIAGRADVLFGTLPSNIENIRAGKLRALAVSTERRWPTLPDVPTIGEFVPGYEASDWLSMCAPKGTSTDIVQKLNREIANVLADRAVQARFAAFGAEAMPLSPADFRKLIAAESVKWAKVVKFVGLKGD